MCHAASEERSEQSESCKFEEVFSRLCYIFVLEMLGCDIKILNYDVVGSQTSLLGTNRNDFCVSLRISRCTEAFGRR